jgi:undecaprenyl-phosphate 4-deoxy-4-formamido-L-arabinose transferase
MLVASLSAFAYVIVMVYRLATGHGLISLWDRDILNFFLNGMILFGLGMIGEYVGRIYLQVRERPRFIVQALLSSDDIEQQPVAAQNAAADSVKVRGLDGAQRVVLNEPGNDGGAK